MDCFQLIQLLKCLSHKRNSPTTASKIAYIPIPVLRFVPDSAQFSLTAFTLT
jgi:hypothetical protein